MNTHVLSALLIALSIFVSGCTKEGSIPPVPDAQIEMIIDKFRVTTGTPEVTNTTLFTYDQDRLVQIKDDSRQWDLTYEDDRLHLITTYSLSQPDDKFSYNIDYDGDGNVIPREYGEFIIPTNTGAPFTFHNYKSDVFREPPFRNAVEQWVGGNLARLITFRPNGRLSSKYFYGYDDNYNYQKLDPRTILFGDYFNKNNEVEWRYEDYIGLIDTACNPCETSYTYNAEGLPTFIEYSWGGSREIIYR